jgi:hypothetical protein
VGKGLNLKNDEEEFEDVDTSRQHIVMIPELLDMGGPEVGSDQRVVLNFGLSPGGLYTA